MKKALIVEDTFENRYLLSYLLNKTGKWQVAEAEDGPSALQLAESFQPHLILMDIGLPGDMDGNAVVRELRSRPSFAATPIIAVSSYATRNNHAEALASGCNGFIEKPIDVEIFVSQLENIMADISRS